MSSTVASDIGASKCTRYVTVRLAGGAVETSSVGALMSPAKVPRVNYKRRAVSILLLALTVLAADRVSAQAVASLAGEWRFGQRLVVIEQDGATIRGWWKNQYRNKSLACDGIWFTGEIDGNAVRGVRYLCPRNTRQPLTITIIDQNTLEIVVSSRGTNRTENLRRIPAVR